VEDVQAEDQLLLIGGLDLDVAPAPEGRPGALVGAQEIREAAGTRGMVPLKRDGMNKVVMGYTSIEEVLNAL